LSISEKGKTCEFTDSFLLYLRILSKIQKYTDKIVEIPGGKPLAFCGKNGYTIGNRREHPRTNIRRYPP